MQYVLLFYLDAARWDAISADERNVIHQQCGVWHDELVKAGRSRYCAGLQAVSTASTLRDAGGKTTITDGPFAETKEFLGGFEIIECSDLDKAIAVAKRFPGLRAGVAVEVRPHALGNECKD